MKAGRYKKDDEECEQDSKCVLVFHLSQGGGLALRAQSQDTSRTPKSVIWFYAGNSEREGYVALLIGEVHSVARTWQYRSAEGSLSLVVYAFRDLRIRA